MSFMINFTYGNIFHSKAEAIVNTVNCVGVMGRGIALQFKKNYPDNFYAYKNACDKNIITPGKMFVFDTQSAINPRYIINFPTKRHWRNASKIEDITAGLYALKKDIADYNIHSIAIPPLGAGLGGLNWNEVKSLMISILEPISDKVEIYIYEPIGTPNHKDLPKAKKPNMTEGRAILIELIDIYQKGLLSPFITLIEIHKLMYFVQVSGQNLRLNYTKGHYGPYALNLKHVLHLLEGHYIEGFGDGGENPEKIITLKPTAIKEANNLLDKTPVVQDHFKRVRNLIEGFESPDGLELLASTHWLITQENLQSLTDVIAGFHSWNSKKKRFTDRQITIAFKTLERKNWLENSY